MRYFQNQTTTPDSLFKLEIIRADNYVQITSPAPSAFVFPESSSKAVPYKHGDFNADGKDDILIYFGACGTGGCVYGLFLNEYQNMYKLAYFDYLKNITYKIEKNGTWTIESSEENEPLEPFKMRITTYRFDKSTYQYTYYTSYVQEVNNAEK